MTDRDGKIVNVPESGWDHSMDGIRYALVNLLKKPTNNFDSSSFLRSQR